MIGAWIGIDLDGTLARYPPEGDACIGTPVTEMIARVVKWRQAGWTVKIVTARIAPPIGHSEKLTLIADITKWWQEALIHYLQSNAAETLNGAEAAKLIQPLPVTHCKDLGLLVLYDDRCVQVEENTGRILGREPDFTLGPFPAEEEAADEADAHLRHP